MSSRPARTRGRTPLGWAVFDPWSGPDQPRSEEPLPGGTGAESGPVASQGPAEPPAVLVRRVGVPILKEFVRRLSLSGHNGAVQDLLDIPDVPSVRLVVWMRPGPLDEEPAPLATTLEVLLHLPDPASLRIRHWRGRDPSGAAVLDEIAPEAVTEDWLRERMLAGLRNVLGL